MGRSKSKKTRDRAGTSERKLTPSGDRGNCPGGGDDDEYVDRDNPSVPSKSIHTGSPPLVVSPSESNLPKSVGCPLRVTDNDAEDKSKHNTQTGCKVPLSPIQGDSPPLLSANDTLNTPTLLQSDSSNNDDVETLLLLIEKWELAFAPSLPFSSTVFSEAAPVDELDCSTHRAPDCDDDDDLFIDEFESYLDSRSPVLTPVHNLRNHLVNDRRVIQLDASTQTDSNDASSSSALNETLTSVALDFVSSNSPAVLIANSMLHQAAKTVQRSIRRFIGFSDKARQRSVATLQQKEDALFNTYLARLRASQLMCMHSRDAIRHFAESILHISETTLKDIDTYREHLAGIPNDTLVQMIQEDRQFLPFRCHVFLSKDVWHRRMFWPIHAGCSDMSPQPELDQIDLPTSNLEIFAPLHKHKTYDLRSYNSHLNIMHRCVDNRTIQHSRLSLKFSKPHYWKRCLSPQVLRQRKRAYFESCIITPRRASDSMANYRRRSDVSDVRMSPSADEYASLGTSFTDLFGTRGSPDAASEGRTNPVTTTIHSWSQQRSSSLSPSEIAASPSPPSFVRDTALVTCGDANE